MPDLLHALQNGTASLWLFIPTAILLGALHGLEPGHSKTMMAAFIIAVRGTVAQAVLLGLSAALSHSLIIWLLAAAALHFGASWNAETAEPYLQMGSAVCILVLAVWMYLRTRKEVREASEHHHHHHHGGEAGHAHDDSFLIDTGDGKLELSIFEKGVPPVLRLRPLPGESLPSAEAASVELVRPDGSRQQYSFKQGNGFLESTNSIPEPHEFEAILTVTIGTERSIGRTQIQESAHHDHSHEGDKSFQDAHERAHAEDIRLRFGSRSVTTPQIILFGVTGGLMPCPAAFSILLVCLQLKRVALGFIIVAGFSFGLALTMVTVGVLAAWSVRHAESRFIGFGEFARRAPYISSALLVLMAAYLAWHGWHALPH